MKQPIEALTERTQELRPGISQTLSKRKTNHQLRVERMMARIHELSNDPDFEVPNIPCVPSSKIRETRARLVLEEALELCEALGVAVYNKESEANLLNKDNFGTMVLSDTPVDLSHVAKEAADLSVVCTGTLSACGICDVSILEEVDAVNLQKFAAGCYIDKNNKLRKPPNFKDANLNELLKNQGWQPKTEKTEVRKMDNTENDKEKT